MTFGDALGPEDDEVPASNGSTARAMAAVMDNAALNARDGYITWLPREDGAIAAVVPADVAVAGLRALGREVQPTVDRG